MKFIIRKAKIPDIQEIQKLICYFAGKDLMLARSLNEIYETLRDFWVIAQKNEVLGCVALHISWDNLAEIKSLAVKPQYQGKGVGAKLVSICIAEARQLGAKKVFVLTYKPNFFKKFGFKIIAHSDLPHKIWAECINCCKFPDCQEIALIKKLEE